VDQEENAEDQLNAESHKSRSSGRNSRGKEYCQQYPSAKHKWIGHVLRHDGLLHTIIEGKRGRERKRYKMANENNCQGHDEMERETKKTPAGRYKSRTCYYISDYYKKTS